MTKLVEKFLPIIKKYRKLNKTERRRYMKNTQFVKCVSEICLNLIKGVVPLKESHKQKLRRHSNIIKKLVRKNKKKNFVNKKKLLQTGGAFLPLLFSVVAPIFTKLLMGKS